MANDQLWRYQPYVEDLSAAHGELGRRWLREFMRLMWPQLEPSQPFHPNWHLDAICDHLQAVSEGEIRRLLITVPPGHAKSLTVSVAWPAWQWARLDKLSINGPDGPGSRAIYTSYDQALAIRDSRRCRDLLKSEIYQRTFRPNWRFVSDQNVKHWFENDRQGFRVALGVNKGTGYRGSCVISDDPLNAKKQHSELALNDVIFWWDQVMSSRVNNKATGAFVIIMQRLSERDLAGHVASDYVHLNMPSEYEPERKFFTGVANRITGEPWQDPRTREGELLFPSLFSREVIDRAKSSKELGAQGYAAQHQQRPAPAEGGIFKRYWWRFWKPARAVDLPAIRFRDAEGTEHEAAIVELPPYVEEQIQSWDCTRKKTRGADFVAGEVWGRQGADVFLLDQYHERQDFPGTLDAIRTFSRKWPGALAKLIEDAANGTPVIQVLLHEIPGILPITPKGSKEERAHAVAPLARAGNVYLPHPAFAPWVNLFIEECATFPNSRHDDWVDAMTQALAQLSHAPLVQVPTAGDDEEPLNFPG